MHLLQRWLKALPFLLRLATLVFAILWCFNPDNKYFAPITLVLLTIDALLSGVDTIISYRTSGPRNQDEIFDLVMESDPSQDWKVTYGMADDRAIFKRDTRLYITFIHDDTSLHSDDFSEKWAKVFPDPHATSHYYDLHYDGTRIDRFVLVHVDGGRARLPMSKSRVDLEVERLPYKIALIFDQFGTCESYMKRAGLYLAEIEKPIQPKHSGLSFIRLRSTK